MHLLSFVVAPSISASPLSQIVLMGTTVEFTCQAPGDPTPTVTWLTSNFVNVLLLGNSRLEVSITICKSVYKMSLDSTGY